MLHWRPSGKISTNILPMQETQVRSLGRDDSLEKEMVTTPVFFLGKFHGQRRLSSVQSLSCVWLCDPMNCSMPGLPVYHQLLEFTQTHVHQVSDAIQPPHPLSSPSPPAPNPSQHQSLFKWVRSSHQLAKVLQFQLQHQSFQRIFRTDFLGWTGWISLHSKGLSRVYSNPTV